LTVDAFRSPNTAKISVIAMSLAAAAVAAPLLARDHLLAAYFLRRCFALVCHQDPARSFWIAGAPLAICVRCLGIYLGVSAGAFLRTSRGFALQLCAIAAALNIFDVLAEAATLHGNLPLPRFLLGLAAGLVRGALLRASFRDGARFPLPAAAPSL
jgi:predicted membrane protein DUF2085